LVGAAGAGAVVAFGSGADVLKTGGGGTFVVVRGAVRVGVDVLGAGVVAFGAGVAVGPDTVVDPGTVVTGAGAAVLPT